MGYVNAKTSKQSTETHLPKLKIQQVINSKKARFLRKLLNKILSKASKDLNCHQIQKLLYKNCKKMQEKMHVFVNASLNPNKSCTQNKRKRKINNSMLEDNDTFLEDIAINTSLTSVNDVSINSVNDNDSFYTDEMTDELEELKPKDIRVKESLRKIAKIRKLPDYKKIEKLLNLSDALTRKKKPSLNSIVVKKYPTPFWNTYSYLLKEIENCAAKKYWSKLTTLLIYLSSAVKKCEPLLLKATIINFISSPTSQIHELFEEFLKECYSCRTEEDIENLLTQLFHIQPKINTSI